MNWRHSSKDCRGNGIVLAHAEAWKVLQGADLICDEAAARAAVERVAQEITAALGERSPLVISVMGGGVVFTGQLLPLLRFPLEFDYLHATRYRDGTSGGQIEWKVLPRAEAKGRVVLVLDDILDQGHTLLAIRERMLGQGASAFYSAVFADKILAETKPIHADFVGVRVPDRYVFGFGMDVHGAWRNLPAVYALNKE
ncbi:MAG: hypoxanthine-guanine phosphoribosyltransferase [Betaproteobacteria bacterium]|nr:hypoxanthine-guanine phosphoribosyltransferase [Betaproteobacteria bacterium]